MISGAKLLRRSRPHLSVVVVSFNMRRELPRTLYSLSSRYQTGIHRDEYEIILVDNGSDAPWTADELRHIEANVEIINLEGKAQPSPAAAMNIGLRRARGEIVGAMIDGARLVTPGLLNMSRMAAKVYPRSIVATVGFHLGEESQSLSVQKGYSAAVEDQLLDSICWPNDGYRLFEIAVLADSSHRGWLGPISECNALFMRGEMWEELQGFCEQFQSAGGGFVNLDTYSRALQLPDSRLLTLLGEGHFHQVHGGIATNSPPFLHWNEWHDEYRRIRGRDFTEQLVSPVLFGSLPPSALRHLRFPKGQSATVET